MNRIIEWFVHNPVASNLLMLVMVVGGVMILAGIRQEEFPAIEYLASQVQVTELTDDGWGFEDGAEQPHRYWISMVTETEDLFDRESGYQVKVVSEHEMVVPVLLTHL